MFLKRMLIAVRYKMENLGVALAIVKLLIAFIVIYVEQHVEALSCYEQSCRHYQGAWHCEKAKEGEIILMRGNNQLYCTELHYGTEKVIYRKYASQEMFWYSDKNFTTQLNETGYACDHTFCFCKNNLCNNRVKVPTYYVMESSESDYDY